MQGALRTLLFSQAQPELERGKARILAGLPRLGQQVTVCNCMPFDPLQPNSY